MRILHLHDSPEIPGGPSGYLGRLLARCTEFGHQNGLFALSPIPSNLSPDFSTFYKYSPPASPFRRRIDFHFRLPPLEKALKEAIQEFSPDLIHIQNWSVFRSTLFPLLAKSQIPSVMTVHDFTFMDPNPWGVPRLGLTGPFRRFLDTLSNTSSRKAAFRAVDRFLCPTEVVLNGLPFLPSKASLHRLPVERQPLQPLPGSSPIRLLFGGSLYPSKGVDVLLHAIAKAKHPVLLELAGAGEMKNKLLGLCSELRLQDSVHFLGHCSSSEVKAAISRCHAVVLPSRVSENSGLILLEGGSQGRPGIGSHLGGTPELLSPPARGWTFNSEDSNSLAQVFDELAKNPQEIARRGTEFRTWIRSEFDPEAHWNKLEEVYLELVS